MGDDDFTADPTTILATAAWIDTSATDFDTDVQSLMRRVHALMDRWKGSAAETHSTAWQQWETAAANLTNALRDDASALRTATHAVTALDSAHSDNIDAATAGLDLP